MSKAQSKVNAEFVEKLIRGICHDVSAPVRHMNYYLDMLETSETFSKLADSAREKAHLAAISDGGQKIQKMLASLAVFARLSMYADSASSRFDLRQVFDETFNHLRVLVEKKNQELEFEINDGWPVIEGSRELWRTLFSSLLENAIMFQKPDSQCVRLGVYCEHNASGLSFYIEDNGIGVSDKFYHEILKPFARLNSELEYSSVGMGLAYCHYIAELNDAQINFSNSQLGGLRVAYTQASAIASDSSEHVSRMKRV